MLEVNRLTPKKRETQSEVLDQSESSNLFTAFDDHELIEALRQSMSRLNKGRFSILTVEL